LMWQFNVPLMHTVLETDVEMYRRDLSAWP
jgi:hypothetical protein